MQRHREPERRPRLCRFIKSYKYKHKLQVRIAEGARSRRRRKCQNGGSRRAASVEIKFLAICDSTTPTSKQAASLGHRHSRPRPVPELVSGGGQTCVAGRQPSQISGTPGPGSSRGARLVSKWLVLALICFTQQQHLFPVAQAFCPSVKCDCDDRLLSANCTNVPSISHIPVTLNPLLRRLTLRQLALVELSNSLAVYRQLEYLDLRSNHLRQVRYENFNFRPAPVSVVLSMSSSPLNNNNNSPSQHQAALIEQARHQELRDNNELLARHLKLSIDKSLSEDEIRFHLRELHLADNRIEQLGSGPSDGQEEEEQEAAEQPLGGGGGGPDGAEVHEPRAASSRRLRSGDLERMAPFLSLTKLELLDLSSNRLRRLHQHVFLGLVHLRQLDLSRNLIGQVDRYAFVGLVELRELRLSNNHLTRLLAHLSVAFCNAPMNQLSALELSDSLKDVGQPDLAAGITRLPNQMFICCPNLRSLQLNALQLRYIQVNAFDNMQRLESLSLAGNYLEQVPSSSLSYSNSNLSHTLKHLDLSETLIEFVNANSLRSLQSLERLALNHMQRLTSFDLAALHLTKPLEPQKLDHYQVQTLGAQQMEPARRLGAVAGEPSSADYPTSHFLTETNPGQSAPPAGIINHRAEPGTGSGPLINDQLVELHLSHNSRLQSVHSSLAARVGARIRFTKLRELNLAESPEIRELPLAEILELAAPRVNPDGVASSAPDDLHDNNLRIDLSSGSSKLNCSSCHMGWLMEAGLRQLSAGGGSPIIGPQPGAFNDEPQPYLSIAQQRLASAATAATGQTVARQSVKARKLASGIVVSQLESLACQLPYPVSLVQFLSLQAASREGPMSHCPTDDDEQARLEDVAVSDLDARWFQQAGPGAGGRAAGPLTLEVPWISLGLGLMALLAVLLLALRLGMGLVVKRRGGGQAGGWPSTHSYQHGGTAAAGPGLHFKWGLATSLTGCSPASSQQSSSTHMCNPGATTTTDYSSASILSSAGPAAASSQQRALFGSHGPGGAGTGFQAESYGSSWRPAGKVSVCSTAEGRLIDLKGFREVGASSMVVASVPAASKGNLFSRLAGRLAPSAAGWRARFFRRSAGQHSARPTLLPHPILAHHQLNQACQGALQDADGPFPHQLNQLHLLPGHSSKADCFIYDRPFNYNPATAGQTQPPPPEAPLGLAYSLSYQQTGEPGEPMSYLNHRLNQTRGGEQYQQYHEEKRRRLDMSASQQQQRHLLEAIADQKHNLAASLKLAGPCSSPVAVASTCETATYLEPINVISSSSSGNSNTTPTTTCLTTQASHHSTASSVAAAAGTANLVGPLTDVGSHSHHQHPDNHHKHLRERGAQVCRQLERPATLSQQQRRPLDVLDAAAGSGGQVERHIYVTLDRPIKQQNGADEYSPGLGNERAPGSGAPQQEGKSFRRSEAEDKFGCPPEQHLVAAGQQMTAPQSSRLSFQAGVEERGARQQLLEQSRAGKSAGRESPERLARAGATNVTGHSDCLGGLVASQTGSGGPAESADGSGAEQQLFMGRNGARQPKGTRPPTTGRSERKKAASAGQTADANGRARSHRRQPAAASRTDHHDDHVINGLADTASNCNEHRIEAARRDGPATRGADCTGDWLHRTMIGPRRAPSAETARRRLSATGFPAASSLSDEMSDSGTGESIVQRCDDYSSCATQQEFPACDSGPPMQVRPLPPSPPPSKHFESPQLISAPPASDTYTNRFYYCRPQAAEPAGGQPTTESRKSRR